MIERWAEAVKNKRRLYGDYPSFEDFAAFIDSAAQTACESITALRHKKHVRKINSHTDRQQRTSNSTKAQLTETSEHTCMYSKRRQT